MLPRERSPAFEVFRDSQEGKWVKAIVTSEVTKSDSKIFYVTTCEFKTPEGQNSVGITFDRKVRLDKLWEPEAGDYVMLEDPYFVKTKGGAGYRAKQAKLA